MYGVITIFSVANAPTIADVKIKPVCKWILDGFNSVPANEQESVLREIRGAVGMEQLDMEGVVLGTLSGEDLRVVANVIVGVLTGVRVEKDKRDEKEVGFKVANEVVSFQVWVIVFYAVIILCCLVLRSLPPNPTGTRCNKTSRPSAKARTQR